MGKIYAIDWQEIRLRRPRLIEVDEAALLRGKYYDTRGRRYWYWQPEHRPPVNECHTFSDDDVFRDAAAAAAEFRRRKQLYIKQTEQTHIEAVKDV